MEEKNEDASAGISWWKKCCKCRLTNCLGIVGILVLLVVVLLLCGFFVMARRDGGGGGNGDGRDGLFDWGIPLQGQAPSSSSLPWTSPTLERIREQGIFKCSPKPAEVGNAWVRSLHAIFIYVNADAHCVLLDSHTAYSYLFIVVICSARLWEQLSLVTPTHQSGFN